MKTKTPAYSSHPMEDYVSRDLAKRDRASRLNLKKNKKGYRRGGK